MAQDLDSKYKYAVYLKTAKWFAFRYEARVFVIKEIKKWPSDTILIYGFGQRLKVNFTLNLAGKSKKFKYFGNEVGVLKWLLERKT